MLKKINYKIFCFILFCTSSVTSYALDVTDSFQSQHPALAVFNKFLKEAYAVVSAMEYCAIVAGVVGVGFTLMSKPDERILQMSMKALSAGTVLVLSFKQVPTWFGFLF